ncbi:hypothetical protein E8E12_004312 [Didymella heteroderae]|uniref:Aminoglycoside phosphotransferase domain-containing protein n=1 Tax=Didymella heteroderae TaxID=1769908 RepID=A0A9P5C2J4_9PLEO|nr:hypothetical protein E8E12_004312 [Didymella heteroderae]
MDFVVGEAIQGEFVRGDHIQLDLHRGPYRTSSAYMSAQLSILLHDIATLSLSFDPRDHKQAEEMHIIHTKLLAVLPLLFSSTDAETTCIYHDDLSLSNILVSSSGEISGIVDWEVIIAAPAWEAFQIPSFLDICPEDRIADALSPSELEDEEAVQDHYNLVQDYEITQLRAFFLEEMGRENPWWLETYEQESTRRDVLVAIANAGNDMYQNRIKGWLDSLLEGRIPRMTLSQSLNEDD